MGRSETDQKLKKQRLIFYEDDIERINGALELRRVVTSAGR